MRRPMQDELARLRPEVAADPIASSALPDAFAELLPFLTVPRENGSAALRESAEQLVGWLLSAGIPTEVID
ncbi:MAG: hypothetical protein HKP30_18205, partial [Myxococcales bacterium]|nr:hypothetical protein [Myxococcales bacterium]